MIIDLPDSDDPFRDPFDELLTKSLPTPLPGILPDAPPDLPLELPERSMALVRPENPGEFGYPPALPIELAAGLVSLSDILDAYGLTLDRLTALTRHPMFKAEYERAVALRNEPNGQVKLQAQLMLPQVLESQFKITQDNDMPPAVRVKAAENIMAIPADLYPKKAIDAGQTAQSIQIVFNAPASDFQAKVTRGQKGETFDGE